jgi:hypothetical protein
MPTLSNTAVDEPDVAMVATHQGDVDAAFADLEHLLSAERPVPVIDGDAHRKGYAYSCYTDRCANCGDINFAYSSSNSGHPGSRVCESCGVVENAPVYWETMYGALMPTKSSNYKRIHHWHERISQLLLLESEIPRAEMLQIAERLCDGTHAIINKDTVRSVLRSLNMQLYIEKWLQIIFKVTRIQPPCPGPLVVQQLDYLFQELQRPFEAHKGPDRKNFLNYNYVFCRLFQKMDCAQFGMFFPLIKSKPKLKSLDDMWDKMAGSIDWVLKPLAPVAPFSVRLEQPALLLQRLGSEVALSIPSVMRAAPLRTVFQRWDRHHEEIQRRKQARHRSTPLAPEFQKLGLLRRRLR